MLWNVMAANAVLLLVCMSLLWLLSVKLKNASIVDPFWGMAFVLVAWHTALRHGFDTSRAQLMLALVTLWGLRLSLYLLVRNVGHGEDYRYRAMRDGHGERFWWVSFFTVFLLQGTLVLIISVPVQAVISTTAQTPLGGLDCLAVGLWLIGFFFEAVGDFQLRRFVQNPENKGKVLNTGVWRYTRHPNYFGDAAQWWAYGLLATSMGAWWTLFAPLIMNFFLLKISGVLLLEKTIAERRPQYREYIEKTSAFVPWFPKG